MVMYGRYLKEVAVLLCALCMYNYTSGVEGSDDKPWKNANAKNIKFYVTYKHILSDACWTLLR